MTYGWAILIIVIVAAVLYSMGIFSPSSFLSFSGITGLAGFQPAYTACSSSGLMVLKISNSLGNTLSIQTINITLPSGKSISLSNQNINILPGQEIEIPFLNTCPTVKGTSYSATISITYKEPTQPVVGPYYSTGKATGTVSSYGNETSSSLIYYAPITLTNNQNTSTPSPFQQMINVSNSTSIWSYINTSPTSFGQNVEFFYPNGTIIPSWLESYNTTKGNAIWWIKVGSIGSHYSNTIYIGFASKSTNLLNTINDGEAPELSGSGDTNLPSNILYSQFFFLRPWFFASGPYVYNFTFDPDSPIYHNLLAPNLENIEFFYANGTKIPAMAISSINSTSYDASSFKIALYLNSVNSYPVILGFASTSTNLDAITSSFSFTPANNYREEAISTVVPNNGIFGKYDDGQDVFQNYTNFSRYYLYEPGCAFSGAGIGFGYGYEAACGNAGSAPIFVLNGLELKMHKGEAVYSYLTPLYPFGYGSTYSYTGGITLGIENALYGGDVGNITAFDSNGTYMNYLSILNESGKNTVTVYTTNNLLSGLGYNFYGIGYSGSKIYLYVNGRLYTINNYASYNSVYPFIGQDGPFVEAKYVFVTNLPPNGVMPSVSFGSVS